MRFLKICIAVFFFYSCKSQTKEEKPVVNGDDNTLLWQVSGKGLKKASYLFGTFHLLCKADIHFSGPLKNAVSSTDEVYMEMDMDDPATLLGGLFVMNMQGGKQLHSFYTNAEYKRIESFFTDSLHASLSLFQNTKPFFLVAMLYPKMMPCKAISGIEEELMRLAKQDKKEIKGLETMEFQASVFDSIPYEEQARELLKSIDSLPEYKKSFDTMLMVYKSQQLGEIEKLFNKTEFGMEGHEDLLLNGRNKTWVGQLKNIMKKESVFVAVGAGHLVGSQGLIALLRKEGYTVIPLQNK